MAFHRSAFHCRFFNVDNFTTDHIINERPVMYRPGCWTILTHSLNGHLINKSALFGANWMVCEFWSIRPGIARWLSMRPTVTYSNRYTADTVPCSSTSRVYVFVYERCWNHYLLSSVNQWSLIVLLRLISPGVASWFLVVIVFIIGFFTRDST